MGQEGWSFDEQENNDLRDAPDEVRTALKDHEAIAYRCRSTQASRHEFPAMIGHLMNRLLPRGGFSVTGAQQDTPVAAAGVLWVDVTLTRTKTTLMDISLCLHL